MTTVLLNRFVARSVTRLAVAALLASSLAACVVAPIGHPRAVVVAGPVVVEPAPVVVAPAPVVVVRPAVRRGYYPYHYHYRY
jgi:hypothetical protein